MLLNRFLYTCVVLSFTIEACVSTGPVQTQIDQNISPVVEKPKKFQSPFEAIKRGYDFLEIGFKRKTKESLELAFVVKAIVDNQASLEKELADKGELWLKPGYSYSFHLESFCVHAGKERPLKGDGLFVGPVQGSPAKWLPQILSDYSKKGISQDQSQRLIWSLLSGLKYDELGSDEKQSLTKIFPDAAVRFGNRFLEDKAKDFISDFIPSEIKDDIDKLEQFRSIISDSTKSFREIETVFAPQSLRENSIPVGWLKTKDGYLMHLTSEGYQEVNVDIYVPDGVSPVFRPSNLVALPSQGQRLSLSPNTPKSKQTADDPILKKFLGAIAGQDIQDSEIELIKKYPIDALRVFIDRVETFNETKKLFGGNFHNDESDAFRHFFWSASVTSDIGKEQAQKFLNAHEDFPENDAQEKRMDLHNNLIGIDFADEYRSDEGRGPTRSYIEEKGIELLKKHELIVIEPSGRVPRVAK